MQAAPTREFIHCRVHSEYAIVDSVIRLNALIDALKAANISAIALTDHMNLFAVVKFYKAALKAGIKPILGCDLQLHTSTPNFTRLTLLCQNNTGYTHLTELLSMAYTQAKAGTEPCIKLAWLEAKHEGLIILAGGQRGEIGQAILNQDMALASKQCEYWQNLVGDRFYLEVQALNYPNDAQYNEQICELATQYQIPVIASNDVMFLNAEDFESHEARVCINRGELLSDAKRKRDYSPEQYLKTPDQMNNLFAHIPSAITNTIELAKRCTVTLTLDNPVLPQFDTPSGENAEDYLKTLAKTELEAYLNTHDDLMHTHQTYQARLDSELEVILRMGFASYFLIVADFIRWAKDHRIAVGPGRGSGAGSLVAYVLKITDLDPLPYDLLFERFLNPERVSMPDFDIDFCMTGRDRVIEYVATRYGRDSVSQIITFGTMAAKAVVRDVGRVLGHPYGFVDQIAKLIPFDLGMTLAKALKEEETLKERFDNDEEVHTLITLAQKLEGLTRNAGKHAGGVVIAPTKLTDFTAIYCEAGSQQWITQFDKDDVETIGLVKFDFLGLRTLTIIDSALKLINTKRTQGNLSTLTPADMSLTDKKPYALLKACNTTAVFQLESRGMKDLIHRLKPDCFEDLVALVALFRPGPLQSGMVDDFIARKHGEAKIEYPHPALEEILKPTYGVILYQEQVMQIAQILAGYSLGAADLLRRAMGKKKAEEMAKQRQLFVDGAKAKEVNPQTAESIFDLMEKFAGYGFNKSHSAAYALIAYHTAWLKTHYPAEFMAAVLSSDMDNTDKVNIFLEDAKLQALKVLPPDINQSNYTFTVPEPNTLRYGLGAIKGVGQGLIEMIVATRKQRGTYQNVFDLCEKLAHENCKINRKALDVLIKAGSFDALIPHRSALILQIEAAIKNATQFKQDAASGQSDLFGTEIAPATQPLPDCPPWTLKETLAAEKESLGLYFSDHPLSPFVTELTALADMPLNELTGSENKMITVAGMVNQARVIITKRGKPMAFVTLEDTLSKIDLVCFSEVYNTAKSFLHKNSIIVAMGEASIDEFTKQPKLIVKEIWDLFQARCYFGRHITLHLSATQLQQSNLLPELKNQLTQKNISGFDLPVQLTYENNTAHTRLVTTQPFNISPSEENLNTLQRLLGEKHVNIVYA